MQKLGENLARQRWKVAVLEDHGREIFISGICEGKFHVIHENVAEFLDDACNSAETAGIFVGGVRLADITLEIDLIRAASDKLLNEEDAKNGEKNLVCHHFTPCLLRHSMMIF